MLSQFGTILAAVLASLSLQHCTLLAAVLNASLFVIVQSYIGKSIGSSTGRSNDSIEIIVQYYNGICIKWQHCHYSA